MYILGIDPGQSGGVSFIDMDSPFKRSFAYSRTTMSKKDIVDEIGSRAPEIQKAILEKVHSMPAQGVASSFKFGTDFGFYVGVLMAFRIPFEEVAPQIWQRRLKCMTKGDKNITKNKAQQMFPGLKITHATADALLIGEYGRVVSLSNTSF